MVCRSYLRCLSYFYLSVRVCPVPGPLRLMLTPCRRCCPPCRRCNLRISNATKSCDLISRRKSTFNEIANYLVTFWSYFIEYSRVQWFGISPGFEPLFHLGREFVPAVAPSSLAWYRLGLVLIFSTCWCFGYAIARQPVMTIGSWTIGGEHLFLFGSALACFDFAISACWFQDYLRALACGWRPTTICQGNGPPMRVVAVGTAQEK